MEDMYEDWDKIEIYNINDGAYYTAKVYNADFLQRETHFHVRPEPPFIEHLVRDLAIGDRVDVNIEKGVWKVGTFVFKVGSFYFVMLDSDPDDSVVAVATGFSSNFRRHFDWENGNWVPDPNASPEDAGIDNEPRGDHSDVENGDDRSDVEGNDHSDVENGDDHSDVEGDDHSTDNNANNGDDHSDVENGSWVSGACGQNDDTDKEPKGDNNAKNGGDHSDVKNSADKSSDQAPPNPGDQSNVKYGANSSSSTPNPGGQSSYYRHWVSIAYYRPEDAADTTAKLCGDQSYAQNAANFSSSPKPAQQSITKLVSVSQQKHNKYCPLDLIASITCHLPIKSLVRLRSVSTSWDRLVRGSYFSKVRLRNLQPKQIENNQNLLVNIYRTRTRHTILFSLDHNAPSLYQTPLIPLSFPCQATNTFLTIIGSAKGLVCISIRGYMELYLWNPVTGLYNKIFNPFDETCRTYLCGFGYTSASKDFKILILREIEEIIRVSVFSLTNGSWKSMRYSPNYFLESSGANSKRGILVNETLYWSGAPFKDGECNRIYGFNLQTERFVTVEMPDDGLYGRMLGDLAGRLGMSLEMNFEENGVVHYCSAVRVLHQTEQDMKWVTVIPNDRNDIIDLICLTNKGHLVYQHNRNISRQYFMTNGENFESIPVCGEYECAEAISYEESANSPFTRPPEEE